MLRFVAKLSGRTPILILLLATGTLGVFGVGLPEFRSGLFAASAYLALMIIVILLMAASRQGRATPGLVSSQEIKTAKSLASEMHSREVVCRRFPECSMVTTSWSIRFVHLHLLLEHLDQVKPKLVVEFGSGISTLLVAAWMREQGQGRLVSVDHDAAWAGITKSNLERRDLLPYVDLVVAPLRAGAEGELPWYGVTDELAALTGIEMAIVDGPPAGDRGKEESRFAALPFLTPRMTPTATVFLDDAARPGEQRVLKRWAKVDPTASISVFPSLSGLAIVTRGGPAA